jgi:uncharacterized protein YdhG (YjbR/CyaY superfamily)
MPRMASRTKAHGSVDAYVADLPPARARIVNRVRRLARQAMPEAREVISYGIPAFRVERTFLYCAAFKGHLGIYPPLRGNAALQKALVRYANEKGNLRFPFDEPMPWSLLTRVVRALAKEQSG